MRVARQEDHGGRVAPDESLPRRTTELILKAMYRGRISRVFDCEAEEKSASNTPESSSDLRIPTLDERTRLYLRAVRGQHDFTDEEYSDARNLILEAMVADFASKPNVRLPHDPSDDAIDRAAAFAAESHIDLLGYRPASIRQTPHSCSFRRSTDQSVRSYQARFVSTEPCGKTQFGTSRNPMSL